LVAGFRAILDNPMQVAPLDVGVFVLDGKVELKDFIAQVTPYRMVYVRQKSPKEVIGMGRLPGSVWEFELKEDGLNEES